MAQYRDMKAYLVADCADDKALEHYEKSARSLCESLFGLDFRADQMQVIIIRPNDDQTNAAMRVKGIAMAVATQPDDGKIRQIFFGFAGGAKCVVRAFTELRREMDEGKFKQLKANTALVTLGGKEYVDPSMAKVVMNVVPSSAGVQERSDFFVLPEAESKAVAEPQQQTTADRAKGFFTSSVQSIQQSSNYLMSSVEALEISMSIADAYGLPFARYLNVTKWKAVLDMLLKGVPSVQGHLNEMLQQ